MVSILIRVNVVKDYLRHCEMKVDLEILKINAEYLVLPSSERVGN